MANLILLDSHVRNPGPRRNLATEHFSGFNASSSVDLRQAYVFARDLARMHADPLRGRPGHRLVWLKGPAFASTTLVAAEEAYAIVGRHTMCGVTLADDPFVALRHLLVRSIALPSGGVALRVLDLQTSLGFTLPDGTRHTSIFAEGPVAIAVGEYAVVALPSESKDDELPRELPAPQIETPPHVRDQLEAVAQAMSPYRQNARPLNRLSRITLMPRPVMIGEPLPPSLGRLSGGRWALTLERAQRSATVQLADEDLVRGIIIGRSEKCHSEMLRRITDVNTSRTHVLVLRDGEAVTAYDLASTQGTFVHGTPVRRIGVSDKGTLLTLGRGDSAVRLYWERSS